MRPAISMRVSVWIKVKQINKKKGIILRWSDRIRMWELLSKSIRECQSTDSVMRKQNTMVRYVLFSTPSVYILSPSPPQTREVGNNIQSVLKKKTQHSASYYSLTASKNILIYQRAAQMLWHTHVSLTLMRLTADVPHHMGKSLFHISLSADTSRKCLSVCGGAACPWIRGDALFLLSCAQHAP